MTGPKGNSEFCFPETLNVPRGEAEANIEVEGKKNSLFPVGSVINHFVITPNSKIEKKLKRIFIYSKFSYLVFIFTFYKTYHEDSRKEPFPLCQLEEYRCARFVQKSKYNLQIFA